MSGPPTKYAFTDSDRDAEFDEQWDRLALLIDPPGFTKTKLAWIAAKRPPIVSFIISAGRAA